MNSFTVALSGDFDAAISRVTDALKVEGFGVLTRIDLDKAFKEKIGVEFRRYAILGACNPKLAHAAVTADAAIGLLLPCNVTVEDAGDHILVRLVDPEAMLEAGGMGADPAMRALMADARARLERAATAIKG